MAVLANRMYANKYASVHTETGLEEASPHKLIQMLMDGFLMQVNSAKGAIVQNNLEAKSTHISRAVAIVGGLMDGLDLDKGGILATNLNKLYEYISTRLLYASLENSTDILDEVTELMKSLKDGWDAIPESYRK